MSVALLTVEALREVPHDAEGRPLEVDARPRAAYLEGHIPGARHMAWEEWCAPGPTSNHPITGQPGYWGRLEDDSAHARTRYARQLEAHGVTHAQPVVVYADGAPSKGREGRIAWMLLYLGVRDVALLDGGWSAWRLAGGPVASGAGPAPSSACFFGGVIQARRRALLPTLRQAYAAGRLPLPIDTRAAADFAGHVHTYLPRMGHLPGAVLLPYDDLFLPSGHFIGRERYLRRLPAGVLDAGAVVTYCEVGVRAATVALLHEAYTGGVVATYDGSLMEWGLDPALPVLTTPF